MTAFCAFLRRGILWVLGQADLHPRFECRSRRHSGVPLRGLLYSFYKDGFYSSMFQASMLCACCAGIRHAANIILRAGAVPPRRFET